MKLTTTLCAICLSLTQTTYSRGENKSSPPNILLIMVDDLGWSDLHCQGNKRLDTPHIDQLAKEGTRFTDAYAAAPVCSPTRAALMTGMAPARIGLTNHISNRQFLPKDPKVLPAETLKHLPLEYDTLAERLKSNGYATGFFGKWHLAGTPGDKGRGLVKFYPEHQGYDLNLGGCAHGGPPTFFDPYRIHNLADRRKGEYLPDRLADEVNQFIKKKREKPFFVTLWNYTVHWPMEAPTPLIEKYKKRIGYGIKDARYAAMIEAMDATIGKILSTLDSLKLREKTLVIFTSDNGGFSGVADNRPLRSGKGYLYEGGIRVPLIIRWPGVSKKNTLCKVPVITMDLFGTILDAAQIQAKKSETFDGESLRPLLSQTGTLTRTTLYFHYPNYAWHRSNKLGSAIREGNFKLIENYEGSVELYNLQKDPSESINLVKSDPKLVGTLRRKLYRWLRMTKAKMPKPKQ